MDHTNIGWDPSRPSPACILISPDKVCAVSMCKCMNNELLYVYLISTYLNINGSHIYPLTKAYLLMSNDV